MLTLLRAWEQYEVFLIVTWTGMSKLEVCWGTLVVTMGLNTRSYECNHISFHIISLLSDSSCYFHIIGSYNWLLLFFFISLANISSEYKFWILRTSREPNREFCENCVLQVSRQEAKQYFVSAASVEAK